MRSCNTSWRSRTARWQWEPWDTKRKKRTPALVHHSSAEPKLSSRPESLINIRIPKESEKQLETHETEVGGEPAEL